MVIFTISGFYLLDFFFNVNPGKVYDISRGVFLIKEQGLYPWLNESIIFQISWTLFRVVIGDLGYYFYHWLMHNIRSLWFFHAVHHSARSLNFLTAYRLHPVDGFVSNVILGAAGGVFAFISMILVGKESVRYVVYGFVFYVPARAVIANLRHSQVWMRFPNWLSRVIMSPAQHQIHHSRDLKYFNKNFSNDFAFFDLLFGTLYIPTEDDYNELVVGIDEQEHNMNPGSIWSCHIQPFINLYHYWKQKLFGQKVSGN
jgi:sterol desaturase/sphingolipid hydroxylase (fatty acid hydroxylase superfamily)